jgi:hypothetical protein
MAAAGLSHPRLSHREVLHDGVRWESTGWRDGVSGGVFGRRKSKSLIDG